jgi:hypothetical protein
MQRPRIRMTSRRWMVVVAFIGLVLGGVQVKRQHDHLSARFRTHARMEEFLRRANAFMREAERREGPYHGIDRPVRGYEPIGSASSIEHERMDTLRMQRHRNPVAWSRMVDYHAEMARKYGRAASYPWLVVEPDPPEPDWVWFFDPFQ